jgi:hypothetical protein
MGFHSKSAARAGPSSGAARPLAGRAASQSARQPSGVLERAAQQKFDVRVQAPEIVRRPALQSIEGERIESEQERLPVGHARF